MGKMSGQLLSSSAAFSKESKLLLITACPSLLSFYMGQHFAYMEPLVISFEIILFLLGVLCIIGCPEQLISKVF